jgi:hypothetical protein
LVSNFSPQQTTILFSNMAEVPCRFGVCTLFLQFPRLHVTHA